MANIYEEISKSNAQGGGKTDANLAQDANHLGGIPAEQYATQSFVKDYHDNKESTQKGYIDQKDAQTLQEAKEYTNSQIRNQDFSSFAKVTDVQALDTKLSQKIKQCGQQCANNLATQINNVVTDTNSNFSVVEGKINQLNSAQNNISQAVNQLNSNQNNISQAVNQLNSNQNGISQAVAQLNSSQNNLFQSVSSGKQKIAGAITDKGVATSANDSFDTMAGNIRNIQTGAIVPPPGLIDTSDANATASDILLGKTAYANGEKIYGTLVQRCAYLWK